MPYSDYHTGCSPAATWFGVRQSKSCISSRRKPDSLLLNAYQEGFPRGQIGQQAYVNLTTRPILDEVKNEESYFPAPLCLCGVHRDRSVTYS